MSEKLREKDLNRRGFLRAGLGGAGVAATAGAATVTGAQASENETEKKKARYKETDHVKAFYRTNRY